MLNRISNITQQWFLADEALFSAFCTHRLVDNNTMKCHMRVGKGFIEINPELCNKLNEKDLDERLRVEMIRILMKHPYERQPEGCSLTARALASNCVIGDAYSIESFYIEHPSDFKMQSSEHFEYYARQLERMLNGSQSDQEFCYDRTSYNQENDEYDDIARTWEQDELMIAQVNDVIRNINNWGTIPGNLVDKIIASTKARIDYTKVLASFRATILSQNRKLTRTRPNRRFGFDAMGSRYDFTTNLIIGVDCSGSISKDDLKNFYTTINRFFQYGIRQIDVIQFDTHIRHAETIEKASKNISVTGRGGTSFQPFIDFVASHHEYDGAIIYTDGEALPPTIPSSMHTPICWILNSRDKLKKHEQWMKKSGKVCLMTNC